MAPRLSPHPRVVRRHTRAAGPFANQLRRLMGLGRDPLGLIPVEIGQPGLGGAGESTRVGAGPAAAHRVELGDRHRKDSGQR
jgi:hypothetical protein